MLIPTPSDRQISEFADLSGTKSRAVAIAELRRLLPAMEGSRQTLPFGLAAVDSCLPGGGLACGALHEVVPEAQNTTAAAFGFIVALLAHMSSPPPLIFVIPAHGGRQYGRLFGHGLNGLGLDPGLLILIETAHRKETLWAMAEALRSGAPHAVVGMIDRLDLKTSQKLHLAAADCGLPLLLIRPAQTLESSAAATRWRVGTRPAARDRFGLYARPRWHLQLERCRNGRPGQWVVEYDHVAHCFSLAAALADPALSRGPGAKPLKQAGRS